MARLLPTGFCWCGCKTVIDLGSFFAPGHDKKAESRVIMEVFGGVPQFLVAFGYGPEGAAEGSSDEVQIAMRLRPFWATPTSGFAVVVEYADLDNLVGPLLSTKREVLVHPFQPAERCVPFTFMPNSAVEGDRSFIVPFVDLVSVFKQGSVPTVRIRGGLNFAPAGVTYVPIGTVYEITKR